MDGRLRLKPVGPVGPASRCFRLQSIRSLSRKGSRGFAPGSRTGTLTGRGISCRCMNTSTLRARTSSAQQVEELTTQLSGVIGQMGGKVTKTEYWGLKSLTYRIRKNRKAHMTLLNVDAPPAALNEIERQERLNEDVLRYLTIRVEAHEDGPFGDDAQVRSRPRRPRWPRGAAATG